VTLERPVMRRSDAFLAVAPHDVSGSCAFFHKARTASASPPQVDKQWAEGLDRPGGVSQEAPDAPRRVRADRADADLAAFTVKAHLVRRLDARILDPHVCIGDSV
jgi:hypothetical protein